MKFWVEGEADFGGADAHELVLIVLGTSELPDNVSQDIVLAGAYVLGVSHDEMMYREDVGHLDIQRWLRFGVKVVKLVNIELRFGVWNIKYWTWLVYVGYNCEQSTYQQPTSRGGGRSIPPHKCSAVARKHFRGQTVFLRQSGREP